MKLSLIDYRELGKARQEEVLSQQIRPLYEGSFPKEERRAWADLLSLLDKEEAYSLRMIVLQEGEQSEFIGFISLWDLSKEWLFVEHFALVAEQRSNGFGSLLLRHLQEIYPTKAILLECEPPSTELAERRLNFYARQGFSILSTSYEQPSYYSDDKGNLSKPLPLCLLGSRPCSADELTALISMLYACVYNFSR